MISLLSCFWGPAGFLGNTVVTENLVRGGIVQVLDERLEHPGIVSHTAESDVALFTQDPTDFSR